MSVQVRETREVRINGSDQVSSLILREVDGGRVQVRFGMFATSISRVDLIAAVGALLGYEESAEAVESAEAPGRPTSVALLDAEDRPLFKSPLGTTVGPGDTVTLRIPVPS